MTKKKTISARDAEDMTKIILEDAIEAEKAAVKKAIEKLPDAPEDKRQLRVMVLNAIKPRGIGAIGSGIDIVVVHPVEKVEMEFSTGYHYDPGPRPRKPTLQSDDMEIIVNEKQWNRCIELTKLVDERSEAKKAIEAKLNSLVAKLDKYKDLAARFRLGFTGDPSDMDAVNHKCREYLLKGEKEA